MVQPPYQYIFLVICWLINIPSMSRKRSALSLIKSIICSVVLLFSMQLKAQDTLRVMTYNVLNYGSGCQGSNTYLHNLLKTVVQYTNPDLLGLVKVHSIKVSYSDTYGKLPVGFADSINNFALNAAYPGKYAYCKLTDYAHSVDNNMDILYYNQNKLGFVSVTLLCNNQEDFDLYKLYYKDPNLSTTHDTTYLYAILNHTISNSNGGGSSAGRDSQDSAVINGLKAQFTHLPNVISMGDFNTATSIEPGYQYYVSNPDTSYLFYDAPFSIDNKINYPCAWNQNAVATAFLNTSTRFSATVPNSCGSSGGAYSWFEHIFMSGWITKNYDYIKYIPNSYQTIGNDGNRFGQSINYGTNNSVPSNVLNALYLLSDKYPVMVKLGVTYNTTGKGPANPVAAAPAPSTLTSKLIHFWDFNQTNTSSDSIATATNPLLPAYSRLSTGGPQMRYYRPQGLQGDATTRDSVVISVSGGSYYDDYSSKQYSYFTSSDSSAGNLYIKLRQPNLNAALQINTPTNNYHHIKLNFAVSASGAKAAPYLLVTYSPNAGATWDTLPNSAGNLSILNSSTLASLWYPFQVDFSSIAAAANNPNLLFRVSPQGGNNADGATASSGNVRLDNFAITGDSMIPCATTQVLVQPIGDTVCIGGTGSFYTLGSGTNITYQWQVNAGYGFASLSNSSVYAGVTTSNLTVTNYSLGMSGYTYRCILTNSCDSSIYTNTVPIIVNAKPTVSITKSGPTTFCAGDSVQLTASTLAGATYLWNNQSTTQAIEVKQTGSYSVTLTTSNGCTATTTAVPVTVNGTVTITGVTSNTPVCSKDTLKLNVSVTGCGPFNYQWSGLGNILSPTTASTGVLQFESGTYSVKVTSAGNTSATSTVTVVNSLPSDLDYNGVVNIQDFNIFSVNYGGTCTGCPSDINQDGNVNIADFLLFSVSYSQSCN